MTDMRKVEQDIRECERAIQIALKESGKDIATCMTALASVTAASLVASGVSVPQFESTARDIVKMAIAMKIELELREMEEVPNVRSN